MSATTQYDASYLLIGPCVGIWADVPLPAPNTKLVLDANGFPPGGVNLGYTDRGAMFNVAWADPPEEAFDLQEKYRVWMANQLTIEGTLCQVVSQTLHQLLLPPAYLSISGDSTIFTFGQAHQYNPIGLGPSVVMVFRHQTPLGVYEPGEVTPYGYAMIYSAVNSTPFQFAVTRRDLTRVNFRFSARPILSRPPTDQIGQFATVITPT